MERVAGWAAREILGRRWQDVAGEGEDHDWLLARAEGLRMGEIQLERRSGDLLRLLVTRWPVQLPNNKIAGVICWVEQVVFDPPPALEQSPCFEICSTPGEAFGQILQVHMGWGRDHIGKRCHEVIADRAEPCDTCPARDPRQVIGKPQTAVVPGPGCDLLIVRATRISERSTQIRHERVDGELMSKLVRARLDKIALAGKLSEREGEVLHTLALGGSVDEIARQLDITPRTVKFHTANVLAKLHLGSRLALVQLLVDPGAHTSMDCGAPSTRTKAARNVAARRRSGPPAKARRVAPRRG